SDDPSFRLQTDLEGMAKLAGQLKQLQDELRRRHPYQKSDEKKKEAEEEAEKRAQYDLALEALGSLIAKFQVIATSSRDEHMCRYAERVHDRRHVRLAVHAAPIDPANFLTEFLFADEKRTVICTSATLSTAGHFEHFK